MDPGWPRSLRERVALLTLLVAGLYYHAKGYYWLVYHELGGLDLRSRWLEQQIVLSGRNPFDLAEAVRAGRAVPDALAIPDALLPHVAVLTGYPPWAYFAGAFVLWPSWAVSRVLYAGLNGVATAYVLVEAHRWGRRLGGTAPWLLPASVWAVSAHLSTLLLGNYGVLVVACLLGALHAHETGRSWLAGVLLGLALTKPTLAAPFLIPYAVTGAWGTLAACAAYLAVGSAVVWWFSAADPITLLGQMAEAALTYVGHGYGPVNLLLDAGIPPRTAVLAAGLVGAGVGLAVSWTYRTRPMLFHFAVAAVVARLSMHHKFLDNVILSFLLLGVGAVSVSGRASGAGIVFVALGLTLWLPGGLVVHPDRYAFTPWAQGLQLVVWVVSAGYLAQAWGRLGPDARLALAPRNRS